MKNVENFSIWRFGYNYLTCCRLIVVLLGFSCLTAVYADSHLAIDLTNNNVLPCTYSLSSTSQAFNSNGGSGSVGVTPSSSICSWIAISDNSDWITITSGSSGSGNGTVFYSVSANTGSSSRTGTITIHGDRAYTFTITQSPPNPPDTRTDGFDYPVGVPDGSGYYVAQNFGDYNSDYNGYHLGEDWNGNGGTNTDCGDTVYSIANGEIVFAENVGGDWENVIIIRHTLTDGSQVESMYGHLRSMIQTSGNVSRGDPIGTIGDGNRKFYCHLHFEIRTTIGIGYDDGYSSTPKPNGWTDPSEFIDSHRTSTSSGSSFWTGNGSIIRYHGRLLSSNAGTDWPYGISQDVTMLHTSSGKPVGFFQWQVNTSGCGNLKIDAPDLSSNEKKVDITVGAWSGRDQDKTFANIQLPFTLGSSNIGMTTKNGDWWVIAVAFKNKVSKAVRLDVDCTNETPTSVSSSAGNSVILEGEYKWNGNGSIISHLFRSLANSSVTSIDWPYGAFLDVTKVHPSSEKPVVFFQWQVWDSGCKQLKLDAPDLNTDEKHVNIEVKEWSNTSPQKVFSDVTLPFTIGASNSGFSMSDGQWLVIKIEFLNPVSNSSTVEARCPGF